MSRRSAGGESATPEAMGVRLLLGLSCLAWACSALQPAGVVTRRTAPRLTMQLWSDGKSGRRSRFEDGDDKRLSAGGSGGRFGKSGGSPGANRRVGVSATERFGGTESARIRQEKVRCPLSSGPCP